MEIDDAIKYLRTRLRRLDTSYRDTWPRWNNEDLIAVSEVVRIAALQQREVDDHPACLCPADGVSFYCPIHGAVATGHGLR